MVLEVVVAEEQVALPQTVQMEVSVEQVLPHLQQAQEAPEVWEERSVEERSDLREQEAT